MGEGFPPGLDDRTAGKVQSLMHDVNDALSLVTGHLTLLAESSGLDRDQRESVLTALEASNEAAEGLRALRRLCGLVLSGSAGPCSAGP
jgi:hypothetical protein